MVVLGVVEVEDFEALLLQVTLGIAELHLHAILDEFVLLEVDLQVPWYPSGGVSYPFVLFLLFSSMCRISEQRR